MRLLAANVQLVWTVYGVLCVGWATCLRRRACLWSLDAALPTPMIGYCIVGGAAALFVLQWLYHYQACSAGLAFVARAWSVRAMLPGKWSRVMNWHSIYATLRACHSDSLPSAAIRNTDVYNEPVELPSLSSRELSCIFSSLALRLCLISLGRKAKPAR